MRLAREEKGKWAEEKAALLAEMTAMHMRGAPVDPAGEVKYSVLEASKGLHTNFPPPGF